MFVNAHGMPIRVIITKDTAADCSQALELIEGMKAEYLLADKGYDSNKIIEQAQKQDMKPVVPPRKNKEIQKEYGKDLYKLRHIIENTFLHLKQWRGIATRYAKNIKSFSALIQIRCLMLRLKIS
jgi:transposase